MRNNSHTVWPRYFIIALISLGEGGMDRWEDKETKWYLQAPCQRVGFY